MASIQKEGDAFYCKFIFAGRRHTFTIGKVSQTEAAQWKAKADHLLMRLDQRLIELPDSVSITEFVKHDGKPPVPEAVAKAKFTTLHELRDAYLATIGNGAVEKNTLATAGIHLDHVEKTLGKGFVLSGLRLASLQGHIARRQPDVSPVTIKKELDTFRTAWNWAFRTGWVAIPYPAGGLIYPKTDEKLPFMTRQEIQRRIKGGADEAELWESLYLTGQEVVELTALVATKKAPVWVHPMVATAAHTGARRSELLRLTLADVNLAEGHVTLREMKRARGVRTTRRVPISGPLAARGGIRLSVHAADRDASGRRTSRSSDRRGNSAAVGVAQAARTQPATATTVARAAAAALAVRPRGFRSPYRTPASAARR